ncbi:hypothetical protein JCM14076_14460 [Methylosoma difficile]
MSKLIKILIIEDNPADFLLLKRYLLQQNSLIDCLCASNSVELATALMNDWDAILSDYNLQGMDFITVFKKIRQHKPDMPILLISGSIGEQTAVELLRLGINDFIYKDNLLRLWPSLSRAMEEVEERRARAAAEAALLANQKASLEAQHQARLAALNLMEEAIAARAHAEAANQALRESEERFRIATENLRDAFILMDGETTEIVLWNAAATAMFGYSKEEAIGQPMHKLIAPTRFQDATEKGIAHFSHSGQGALVGQTIELPAMRRNGEEFATELSISAMLINGKWHGAGVIRDITLRKQAEDELRQYRDQLEDIVEQRTAELSLQSHALQAMIDNIPHMAWMKDREGRFLAANRAVAEAIGQSSTELIGKGYFDIWPEAIADLYCADNEEVMATRTPKTFVQPLARQQDSLYEIFIAPIVDANDEVIGTAGFSRDIKPQREMEAELALRASVAEAATEAKTHFLTNMSHEIRTPMNAIIGLTYLLKQTPLNLEQSERLEKIDTAAQHLLSIINDILDLSKIEAGHLQLEQIDFSLPALMDNIYSLAIVQAKAKGLNLYIDTDNVPNHLCGDLTRLRQALINYVSNAIKFTEEGCISIRCKLLDSNTSELLIRFEVEDTGIGIDEKNLPRLFEAFSQADVSTTRKYGGTGLGLAITKHLANLMGGETGVDSAAGKGSTFWFTAQIAYGKPITETHTAGSSETQMLLATKYVNARLLLAEDNSINREVVVDLLHSLGLTIDIAENGRIAVEKARSLHYDLILMDVQMPELDGLSATKALRAQFNHNELPIIAMTANVFEDNRETCFLAGMNDFISKPVNPEALYATLLHWLSKKAFKKQDYYPAMPKQEQRDQVLLGKTINPINIDGLDSQTGLTILKGNTDKYKQLLRMFVSNHHHDMQQVHHQITEGHYTQAQHLAHTLKGVAATLGANELAEAAKRTERAILEKAPLEECLQLSISCDSQLTVLIDNINAWLSQAEPLSDTSAQPLDNEALTKLAELEQLLSDSNSRANQLAQELGPVLRGKLGDQYFDFMRHIEVFDYESALKTLCE